MIMSSSSRRLSVERSRLRMDSYSGGGPSGRSRPSPPRRRELDNVMKKARKEGPDKSSYWNKKLLEVEEKDPNRWRHSGFKELYGGGGEYERSASRSRSRSRSRERSRSFRPRSPPPRPKSPPPRPPSPWRTKAARPRSPKPRPKSPPSKSSKSAPKSRRPPSPPPRGRSESLSSGSVSSCSDESCSVCSPKTKRRPQSTKDKERDKDRSERDRERERERDREREREKEREKEREREKEQRERERERELERSKVVESPRPALRSRSRSFSVPRNKPPVEKPRRKTKSRKRDKEKTATIKAPRRQRRPAIKVESESERSSSPSPGPRLTLSERFGKMAQWSVDRNIEYHRNLRITAGDQLTVEMDSPPSPSYAGSIASLPEGAWDDVRVRYTYYKEQGYLRDLTLQDYVKWEEWWYKYQDWLDSERSYDRITKYWEKNFNSRSKRFRRRM